MSLTYILMARGARGIGTGTNISGHALLAARLAEPGARRGGTRELPRTTRPHFIGLKNLGKANVSAVQVEVLYAALETVATGFDPVLDGPALFPQGHTANVKSAKLYINDNLSIIYNHY